METMAAPWADERLRVEVAAQLERILADELFAASERTARFLRYVVEQTLAGKAAEIKELVIAVEVYARAESYDPKRDSTVRVEASRLRTKLRRYYERRGAGDPIHIAIPRGAYVPQFTRVDRPTSGDRVLVEDAHPATATAAVAPGTRLAPAALAFALVVSVVLVSSWSRRDPTGGRAGAFHPAAAVSTEALAAWREGDALLKLDPHTSVSGPGLPPTLARAIDRFEHAVAASPEFARAWASLAEAYEYASAFVGRDASADARRAEDAATRAAALDPSLPEAHAMVGLVRFYLRWDFAGAASAYQRAIALDPRSAWAIVEYADLLRETGRVEQARAEIRAARVLQPALPVLALKEAEILLDLGQHDAALAAARSAQALKRDSPRAHAIVGMAREAKGDVEGAVDDYRRAVELDAHDRRALPLLGHALATLGRRVEAQRVLQRLEAMNANVRTCAFQIAVVHIGLGDREAALDWLERALVRRQMHLPFMVVERRFAPLRGTPRFEAIVTRLGLQVVAPSSPGSAVPVRNTNAASPMPMRSPSHSTR